MRCCTPGFSPRFSHDIALLSQPCLLRSVEAEREAERKAAQAKLADLTLKMDGLRQQMQQQEKEFGSGTEDINKLRGELEAANAHISDVQQVCTYMIIHLSMLGRSRSLKTCIRSRGGPQQTPRIYKRERLRATRGREG